MLCFIHDMIKTWGKLFICSNYQRQTLDKEMKEHVGNNTY